MTPPADRYRRTRPGPFCGINWSEPACAIRWRRIARARCAALASGCWTGRKPSRCTILRLLNLATSLDPSVRRHLRPRIKESLEELAEAGDLAELANGRWLPAPTREVRLETADDTHVSSVGGTADIPSSAGPQFDARTQRRVPEDKGCAHGGGVGAAV